MPETAVSFFARNPWIVKTGAVFAVTLLGLTIWTYILLQQFQDKQRNNFFDESSGVEVLPNRQIDLLQNQMVNFNILSADSISGELQTTKQPHITGLGTQEQDLNLSLNNIIKVKHLSAVYTRGELLPAVQPHITEVGIQTALLNMNTDHNILQVKNLTAKTIESSVQGVQPNITQIGVLTANLNFANTDVSQVGASTVNNLTVTESCTQALHQSLTRVGEQSATLNMNNNRVENAAYVQVNLPRYATFKNGALTYRSTFSWNEQNVTYVNMPSGAYVRRVVSYFGQDQADYFQFYTAGIYHIAITRFKVPDNEGISGGILLFDSIQEVAETVAYGFPIEPLGVEPYPEDKCLIVITHGADVTPPAPAGLNFAHIPSYTGYFTVGQVILVLFGNKDYATGYEVDLKLTFIQ